MKENISNENITNDKSWLSISDLYKIYYFNSCMSDFLAIASKLPEFKGKIKCVEIFYSHNYYLHESALELFEKTFKGVKQEDNVQKKGVNWLNASDLIKVLGTRTKYGIQSARTYKEYLLDSFVNPKLKDKVQFVKAHTKLNLALNKDYLWLFCAVNNILYTPETEKKLNDFIEVLKKNEEKSHSNTINNIKKKIEKLQKQKLEMEENIATLQKELKALQR